MNYIVVILFYGINVRGRYFVKFINILKKSGMKLVIYFYNCLFFFEIDRK